PEGEAKDLPKSPFYSDSWQLGKPDMVLQPPAAAVSLPEGESGYRTIAIPTNLLVDRWVRAVDFKPGDGSRVHCAAIYAEDPGDPPTREDRPAGHLIGYWMPGQKTVSWPAGDGLLLKAASRLIVRIHYTGSGTSKPDQSQVAVYFADKRPAREVNQAEIDAPQLRIQVVSGPQRVTASYTLQEDSKLLALRPAVSPLIVSLQATAYRPDGSVKVLVWTTGNKWDWAPIYYERRPVELPKGTRIETTVYFDNSNGNKNNPNSPAKEVGWSSLSGDPFCTLMLASKTAD
ncbi:MAG: hypothetical protein ACREAC_04250, partial [Blastocatellia bacterium]